MDNSFKVLAGFISALVFFSCVPQSFANIKEIKAYKEAFPGATVKCMACHSMAMPKKEAAGLNPYGQAAVAANSHPTAETFKQLGKAEDFKGK